MYHVAVGIPSEDEQIPHKVDVVSELPHSTDSVRVTLIHVHDGEASVESVPPVTEAIEGFTAVGIETEVHSVINENAPRGLLEGAAALDADLLCIGGRRRSPAGKLQLKNGAQEVLIHADQPVVVAGKIDE